MTKKILPFALMATMILQSTTMASAQHTIEKFAELDEFDRVIQGGAIHLEDNSYPYESLTYQSHSDNGNNASINLKYSTWDKTKINDEVIIEVYKKVSNQSAVYKKGFVFNPKLDADDVFTYTFDKSLFNDEYLYFKVSIKDDDFHMYNRSNLYDLDDKYDLDDNDNDWDDKYDLDDNDDDWDDKYDLDDNDDYLEDKYDNDDDDSYEEEYFKIKNPYYNDLKGHWAEMTINEFKSAGYVNGNPDGTFKPNDAITRAEFVTMLNNYFGLTKGSGKTFTDTVNHWANKEIDIAVSNGVCNGTTATTFSPNAPITREQAAVMLANYMGINDTNLDKINAYSDSASISSWSKSSLEAMIEKGYLYGYTDNNTLKPKNNMSRAEAVVTLNRIPQKK